MVGLETLFVIGGAGITLGLLDNILKAMGKEEIGIIISVLATGILGVYTVIQIDSFFTTIRGLFL
jgi:hypothetical protein